jgi:hypothetical protein
MDGFYGTGREVGFLRDGDEEFTDIAEFPQVDEFLRGEGGS